MEVSRYDLDVLKVIWEGLLENITLAESLSSKETKYK